VGVLGWIRQHPLAAFFVLAFGGYAEIRPILSNRAETTSR
jgi:hypothetical protein